MTNRQDNIKFKIISVEKVNFGRNNFIEIARRKAITEDEENEYISVTRGYYLGEDREVFKKSLTVPDDEEVKKFIAEKLLSM